MPPSTGRDDYLRETERWLAPLTRELSSRAPVTTEVLVGDPGTEINALAQREAADLIVMGRRGRWRRDRGADLARARGDVVCPRVRAT